MSRNSTPFVISLGVRDAETVERALRAIGTEGERALERINRAAAREELRQRFRPAVDEARASVEGLAGAMGPAGTALSGFGTTGLAAAAGLAVFGAGLVRGVREAEEAEVSVKKLEGVLRATGGAAGKTAQDIQGLAEEMARTRLVTPEQVQDAASVLLTFRSVVGDTFDEAIGLAQDLGSVFGGDMRSSATLLGKALEDPVEGLTALRRVGVTFSASQQDVIRAFVETGDKAAAQAEILKGVARQVGGAGASEGDSLRGAFHRATEAAGAFFEALARGTGTTYVVRVALDAAATGLDAAANVGMARSIADQMGDVERRMAELEPRLARARAAVAAAGEIGAAQRRDLVDPFTGQRSTQSFADGTGIEAEMAALQARAAALRAANQEAADREAMQANAVRERADAAAEQMRQDQLATRRRVLDDLATAQQREIELSRLGTDAAAVAAAGDKAVAEAKRAAKDAQVALTDAEIDEIRTRAEGVERAKQLRKETEDLTKARAEALETVDQQAAGLRAEAEGLKLSARERFVANETLKAENALRKAKIDLESEEARVRLEQVRQGAEGRFDAETVQAATRAVAERQAREQERQRTEAERQWARMFDRVTDYGADALYDAMTGRITDIGALLRATLLRAVAQGASEAVIRPVLQSAAQSLGLGVGGAGGTGVGFGGLPIGGFGGVQSFLFGSGASYGIGDALLSPATSGILGTGGTLFGSSFAADAFLPGIGAALPGLLSGNFAQAGLGAAGALAGTFFGGPIGGAIGGTLGNLVGGLFGGGGRGDPYVQSTLTLGNGQLFGGAAGDNGADPSSALARAQSLAASVNTLASTFGLSITAGGGLYGDRAQSEASALATVVRGLSGGSSARIRDALASSRGSGDLQTVASALQAAQALDRMAAAADLVAGRTTDYAAILRQATDAQRDQAAGVAANTVRSLADYARSLQVGERSPLSAQDQLAAARAQFEAVAGGARAGSPDALGRFRGAADAYLEAARAVEGSGAGYVTAFRAVTGTLGEIGTLSADQLTAQVFAASMQGQTVTLATGLESVRAEVAALRDQLRGIAVAPPRLVA